MILQRAEIKPHPTEYWIMSDFSQPEFEERMVEVCGLYVDPPENVLVLSLDEKTGIQAKAPVKPDVAPAPDRPAQREHESRWTFQFTPKYASWLNQIEIFFSILYRRPLKHGIFTSEDDLAQQMLAYIEN